MEIVRAHDLIDLPISAAEKQKSDYPPRSTRKSDPRYALPFLSYRWSIGVYLACGMYVPRVTRVLIGAPTIIHRWRKDGYTVMPVRIFNFDSSSSINNASAHS